jgi:CubicO group peptidase (beta-lactamase class C family)
MWARFPGFEEELMSGLVRCIGAVTLAAFLAAHPAGRAVPAAQTPAAKPAAVWPGDKWPIALPDSQGLSAPALTGLDKEIREGVYGNVDRIFVTRNGHAVMNERYARDYRTISRGRTGPLGCGEGCTDQSWMHEFNYYHPNWHPYYQGREVHTLQSVTKSIAATVIGIAIGRGEVGALDRPFLQYFKDRDLSRVDPRLHASTLADLLTMRSGIEWHEQDRPLDDTNTTVQLEKSKDWIAFTLGQPMDAGPGAKWAYNSGGSQLLSGIIRSATGRFIDDYASEFLFRPIGIRDFHWKKTPTGHPDTEGGLYLSAEDLARIGYLYLHDGVWDGRRILPAGWVRNATTRHAKAVAGGWDYGYQWWIMNRNGVDIWAGRGFGGQFLIVIPDRGIVAAVNSWNIFGGRTGNVFAALLTAILGA